MDMRVDYTLASAPMRDPGSLARRGDTIVLLDGAMGTMLKCMGSGTLQVGRVHDGYVRAGAGVILTNTFRPDREERIRAAVAVARMASGGRALVAGDIGPGGDYDARAAWLMAAGVDLLVIETMIEVEDARRAVAAARRASGTRPVLAMMSFEAIGRTRCGATVEDAAHALVEAGADIVGANCSVGPEPMVRVIERMRAVVAAPLAAKPSAGLPSVEHGRLTYPVDPDTFARWAVRLHEAGATFVGGCCGTTPQHIEAVARALRPSDGRDAISLPHSDVPLLPRVRG